MMNDYEQQMLEDYERTINQNAKSQGGFGVVCPHSFDTKTAKNDCVLCNLCKEVLFDRSTPKNDPLKEKARNLNAKKRYYSNMIFMANPSEVVVLEYGEKIFNKLIVGQFDALSEWKNFMHPTQGRNLYITKVKVGSEKKDVDYNVEPRMSISTIPDPAVLHELYPLPDILALIESGKVKPVYQSKFDFVKTEVRFLPSGDKTKPFLFYKSLLWHYNVTKDDFANIQAGRYNLITNTYLMPPSTTGTDVTSVSTRPLGYSKIPVGATYQQAPQSTPPPPVLPEQSQANVQPDPLAEWADVGGVDTFSADLEGSTSASEPTCYSQYDENNPICVTQCAKDGWAAGCKKIYAEKLALRAKARRLSK